MNEERLNPESLLKRVQAEERKAQRGKLKIYLGAAPGVGKTYSMLEDANQQRKEGLDVVVGVVESHGRKDIEALLQGLETIPKYNIDYKGITLEEFDLDAALKRSPGLILIDEMAHSNVEGSRHAKRWQDIKELLDRGIDVYTTLNVQHIESLNNNVSEIISAPIKETVPDSMLELADTIELIDLPPEDLLKRLQEGKVYFPERAAIAKDNFFRKGNLIALRELALRVTAQRVGAQVLLYRQGLGIKHIWSSAEKILVCVCAGNEGLELIRTARRLAASLQASWLAIYVDSHNNRTIEVARNGAIKNLRLAEQLGAETAVITGQDIVKEIITYARSQNVTLIMVWKQILPRWKDFWKMCLADEIVRHSGEINVYIITGNKDKETRIKSEKTIKNKGSIIGGYLLAVAMITFATLVNFLLLKLLTSNNIVLIYVLAVTMVAIFGKFGPLLVSIVLSVIAYNWFFSLQDFDLSFTDFQYLLILVITVVVAKIISNLNSLNKMQAAAARNSEFKATALHRLSRKLASTRGVMKLLEIGAEYIAEFFDAEVMVLLPEDGQLAVKLTVNSQKILDPKELAVAQWVYDLGQVAGLGTDTLPQSDALYIPLQASQSTIGVFRIKTRHPEQLLTPDQMHFLESCANQIALTIEVDNLQENKEKIELEREVDHTRNVLLQSISQDLRAPLAAIMLTARSQIQAKNLTTEQAHFFAQTIYKESDQLSRLINNLLQITYLENKAIKLHKEPSSLQDTLNKVIKSSREKLENTPIYVNIPITIPLIPFDKILIEGVFVNLLDNALKFAPLDQAIEIFAELNSEVVVVSFEDHGPGIHGDEVSKLFEKFYKGRMLTSKRGLGLGLAICRIIVEAHGGQIWAENRKSGGAAFKFSLPLK